MKPHSQSEVLAPMFNHYAQLDIARRCFHAALIARDWSAIRALFTDDAQWTLPIGAIS